MQVPCDFREIRLDERKADIYDTIVKLEGGCLRQRENGRMPARKS
jgi:hypothetical protein